MRIEGHSPIDPRGVDGKGLPPALGKSPQSAQGAAFGEAEGINPMELPYVKSALACEEVNMQAVEEARKLLSAGQLDTPAAIQSAARKIVDLGL